MTPAQASYLSHCQDKLACEHPLLQTTIGYGMALYKPCNHIIGYTDGHTGLIPATWYIWRAGWGCNDKPRWAINNWTFVSYRNLLFYKTHYALIYLFSWDTGGSPTNPIRVNILIMTRNTSMYRYTNCCYLLTLHSLHASSAHQDVGFN